MSNKTVILIRGNGSQHAIMILGDGKGLDLEDFAAGSANVDVSTSFTTRIVMTDLAADASSQIGYSSTGGSSPEASFGASSFSP